MIEKARDVVSKINKESLLSFWIITYVIRMSVPHLNYLFIGTTMTLLLFTFLRVEEGWSSILKKTKPLVFFLILLIITSVSLLFSLVKVPRLLHEIVQIPMLLIFIFSLLVLVKSKADFDGFIKKLLHYFYYSSIIVSLIGVFKFICLSVGVELPLGAWYYPQGTSLTVDYNFYALALISGLISYFFLAANSSIKYKLRFESLFLVVVPIATFGSGSRRGFLMIFGLYLTVLFFFMINKVLKKKIEGFRTSFLFKILKSLVVNVAIVYCLFFSFAAFKIELPQGEKILAHNFRIYTTNMFYRYGLIFDGKVKFENVFDNMWYDKAKEKAREQVGADGLDVKLVPDNRMHTYSPRTKRWSYSVEYFRENYNNFQQWFGGGFGYMKAFGVKFGAKPMIIELEFDYPHNVFLSALLSNGWVGFVLLVYLVLASIMRYVSARKTSIALLSMFLISLLYVSTSANSFLAVPYFSVLLVIGLYSNSFLKKKADG